MARRLLGQLYIQVLIGIGLGVVVGLVFPDFATRLQPPADGFIKLIKMLLAPVVLATVVLGIAKTGDIKEGRSRPCHRRCRHRRTKRGHSPQDHHCRSRSPAPI